MTATVTVLVTLESAGPCCECGTHFAVDARMLRELRATHRGFYCPNGHSLVFKGESAEERLKRELDQQRAKTQRAEELAQRRGKELDNAQLQVRMTRGKLRALKVRVGNGVCPCCHRSFVQLARHMRTRHPAWVEVEERTKREIDGDNG